MNQTNSNKFSSFKLSKVLLSAIKKTGYTRPTRIQAKAIPLILAGGDVLASAETGSGKTTAFVLPVLQKIIEQKKEDGWMSAKGRHVRALILVPTRELVVQVREEVNILSQDVEPAIRCLSVYGGVKMDAQMRAMKSGVDILIATPNRLLDLTKHQALKFNKLQTVVIDEADRLVDSHFRGDIEAVVKRLPVNHQKLLFTATFPDSIRLLVRAFLDKPSIINLEQNLTGQIDQHVVRVNADKKYALLAHLLKENDWHQVLVFCSAKKTCDRVVEKLAEHKIEAIALHGNKEQKERLAAVERFKSGDLRVLIATDVASRGFDVESLDCVINYELPRSPNDYIHRIGRTGRAGQSGQAISLIAHHEYAHFSVIEKRNNLRLEHEQVVGFEASETAPPPPGNKPKKKGKVKLSKKKRQKLRKKLDTKTYQGKEKRKDIEVDNKEKVIRPARAKPAVEKKAPVKQEANPWAQGKQPVVVSASKANPKNNKDMQKKKQRVPKKAAAVKKETSVPTDGQGKSFEKQTINEHIWGKRDS